MKTTLHKQRKTTRAGIVRKLDRLTSLITRKREPYCVICGSDNRLTNGHLFSRIAYSLRWDVTEDGNCHTQCWSCNYKHEYDSFPYTNWYIQKFGLKKYNELHQQYVTPVRLTTVQLEAIKAGLESLVEGLK